MHVLVIEYQQRHTDNIPFVECSNHLSMAKGTCRAETQGIAVSLQFKQLPIIHELMHGVYYLCVGVALTRLNKFLHF